jgi:hypothetical protein
LHCFMKLRTLLYSTCIRQDVIMMYDNKIKNITIHNRGMASHVTFRSDLVVRISTVLARKAARPSGGQNGGQSVARNAKTQTTARVTPTILPPSDSEGHAFESHRAYQQTPLKHKVSRGFFFGSRFGLTRCLYARDNGYSYTCTCNPSLSSTMSAPRQNRSKCRYCNNAILLDDCTGQRASL